MKIERNGVLQLNHLKGSESRWRWQAENIRQEGSGANFVGAPNDCVVQLYAHMDLLTSLQPSPACELYLNSKPDPRTGHRMFAIDSNDLESKIQVFVKP
jgi:hypothetical protein